MQTGLVGRSRGSTGLTWTTVQAAANATDASNTSSRTNRPIPPTSSAACQHPRRPDVKEQTQKRARQAVVSAGTMRFRGGATPPYADRLGLRLDYFFVPITEQRYTSVVGDNMIWPASAAVPMSVSEVNCCGAIVRNSIWTSCQSGLKPSPWIASMTLTKEPPPGSCPSQASHM